MGLRAVELAQQLGLSKGRISQLVAEGKLAGCYAGDGIHRRFDLAKAATALSVRLDRGQMLGNGADTKKAIRAVIQNAGADRPAIEDRPKPDLLPDYDPDRYELARSARAEEELRAMRLRNSREEGMYVLASEVDVNVSRVVAQSIAETEVFLKDLSRLLADKLAVDAREVRELIRQAWRRHRDHQAKSMAQAATVAVLSDAEKAAQI